MTLNYFARVFPEKTYWRNIMQLLEEKIKTDGVAVNEDILKVDSFINHKVDPFLMKEIGKDFAAHFADHGITKIVTIESSGIAPALTTAIEMGIPMVILKKQPSKVLNKNLYQTMVTSFTSLILLYLSSNFSLAVSTALFLASSLVYISSITSVSY